MNEQVHKQPNEHLKTAYYFINIILFAPIILWPIPLIIFNNPMLSDIILPKWYLGMIILLFTTGAMDSILYGITNHKQTALSILWFSLISILTLQNMDNPWLFAVLFLAHSLRPAVFLISPSAKIKWWLKPAWARDICAALCIFLWLALEL